MISIKKILKWIGIIIIIGFILYSGILIYAKLSPKLAIDSANGYYIYDSEGNKMEEGMDEWIAIGEMSPEFRTL